jgi:hypothetical protein
VDSFDPLRIRDFPDAEEQLTLTQVYLTHGHRNRAEPWPSPISIPLPIPSSGVPNPKRSRCFPLTFQRATNRPNPNC